MINKWSLIINSAIMVAVGFFNKNNDLVVGGVILFNLALAVKSH